MDKDDNSIIKDLIKFQLNHEIEDSESTIRLLNHKVEFYNHRIEMLEQDKPFFFQKKKLEKYNKELEECKNTVKEALILIEQEMDFIFRATSIDKEE